MNIAPLIKLWLAIRPIKRFKERKMKNGTILEAILRHALTFGGGAAVISDNEVAQLSGALATLVGVSWSIYQKIKNKE